MDRIVVATTGGPDTPHMKYRLGPLIREGPWPAEVIPANSFPEKNEIDAVVAAGGRETILVLQRVLPPVDAMRRLGAAYDRLVFDFDDAIYATRPVDGSALRQTMKRALRLAVRGSSTASSRRRPLARVLRRVDVCVAGNAILAEFARRFAPQVVEIPTTIEPVPRAPAERPDPPVLVWIGLPTNLRYLELVRKPLERLVREFDFRLRIVSRGTWPDAPVEAEFVQWSSAAQRAALLTSTVGLSPLTDDPWTRGKCAHRAIVYGAHALAAVASPVGITDRVIIDGETGFLARSAEEWYEALRLCITDPGRAAEAGAQALERIRHSYSDEVSLRSWRQLITELADHAEPGATSALYAESQRRAAL